MTFLCNLFSHQLILQRGDVGPIASLGACRKSNEEGKDQESIQ